MTQHSDSVQVRMPARTKSVPIPLGDPCIVDACERHRRQTTARMTLGGAPCIRPPRSWAPVGELVSFGVLHVRCSWSPMLHLRAIRWRNLLSLPLRSQMTARPPVHPSTRPTDRPTDLLCVGQVVIPLAYISRDLARTWSSLLRCHGGESRTSSLTPRRACKGMRRAE